MALMDLPLWLSTCARLLRPIEKIMSYFVGAKIRDKGYPLKKRSTTSEVCGRTLFCLFPFYTLISGL